MNTIQGQDISYTLLKELGRGSFGITYKAKGSDGKDYAIKEFKPSMNQYEDRKLEEDILKLITSICDQYAVCFVESIDTRGKLYMVMDFIKGNNLSDIIFGPEEATGRFYSDGDPEVVRNSYKKLLKIDERRAVGSQFIKDMILGLNALHSNELAHQDIKGDNLMYSNGRVKFIDFGLSCVLNKFRNVGGNQVFSVALNYPCGVPGTWTTSPPEMFEYNGRSILMNKQEPVSDKTLYSYQHIIAHDIWSIGCVILEWYIVQDDSSDVFQVSALSFQENRDYFRNVFSKLEKDEPTAYNIIVSLLVRDPLERIDNFKKFVDYYNSWNPLASWPYPQEIDWDQSYITVEARKLLKEWRCKVRDYDPYLVNNFGVTQQECQMIKAVRAINK